jgi:hypothetical protein
MSWCPDGFTPAQAAIVKAAHGWFPQPLEKALPQLATSDGSIDAAVQSLRQLDRAEWPWDAFVQTVNRIRNCLYQDEIRVYYFSENGSQSIGKYFWAKSESHDVLVSGLYWPNGDPSIIDHRDGSIVDEQLPSTVFFKQSELAALLSEPPAAQKRRFPSSKMPELIETLRKLEHLTRREQRDAIRKMPGFDHMTERNLQEAARAAPRTPGRRPRNPGK